MARPSVEKERSRWLAVSRRDPAANSSFLYGVTTTRIFCRPTCTGRVARRANVIFFDYLHVALESGYRPCMRCQPHNDGWSRESQCQHIAYRARDLIATAIAQGVSWTMQEIAKNLCISEAHLYRQFKKCHGCTPKVFASMLQDAARELSLTYDPTPLTHVQCLNPKVLQVCYKEWLQEPELVANGPVLVSSAAMEDSGLSLHGPLSHLTDSTVFADNLDMDMISSTLDVQDLSAFFD